jgi:Uri superfamily endonuclease
MQCRIGAQPRCHETKKEAEKSMQLDHNHEQIPVFGCSVAPCTIQNPFW